MKKLVINSSGLGNKLEGDVWISGAKNAVLPIMAAALMCSGRCIIKNVPKLDDVLVMLSVLEELGVRGVWREHCLELDCRGVQPKAPTPEVLGRIRASNLILGPLLGRFKEAEIGACGGCSIGSRPMNLHFAALEALGAKILPLAGGYVAFAKSLNGAEVHLAFPSVGATENLLMAAALSEGRTVLHNAAREPEIVDLAGFINAMGGKIRGAGDETIEIDGVKRLGCGEYNEYTVMPDRIEAGTYMIAAAMCGGAVRLIGAEPGHNQALLEALAAVGIKCRSFCGGKNANGLVEITGGGRPKPLQLSTASYPGFPTDLQPQLVAMLCRGEGCSRITEKIFEKRFEFVGELNKMGAAIHIQDNCATIQGVPGLFGARVKAPDLRAGAALVLAGLCAEGCTEIGQTEYIDRGYEDFAAKLRALGADICQIEAGAELQKQVV